MGHIGNSPTGGARPAEARFRRLVERASQKFGYDCCHCCKRPFRSHETMLVGRVRRGGGVRIVGDCCGDRLGTIIGGGIYVALPEWVRAIPSQGAMFGPPDAAWSADDREWFARHRDRSHRLRPSLPGEWAHGATHTITRQGRPGERVRLPITATADLPADDVPELACWSLFDLVIEHRQRGSTEIPTSEIIARCKLRGEGGTA
jgi:hypothetical protein